MMVQISFVLRVIIHVFHVWVMFTVTPVQQTESWTDLFVAVLINFTKTQQIKIVYLVIIRVQHVKVFHNVQVAILWWKEHFYQPIQITILYATVAMDIMTMEWHNFAIVVIQNVLHVQPMQLVWHVILR